MTRIAILALAVLVLSNAPAHAETGAAFECLRPYDETSRAIAALRPLAATPPIQAYAPGDTQAYGWPAHAIWTAADSESRVVVVRIAAPISSILPEVLRRRRLEACPRSFGVTDYCHVENAELGSELVVQSDPETPGATLLICSFSTRH
jgi:hypothetical protein